MSRGAIQTIILFSILTALSRAQPEDLIQLAGQQQGRNPSSLYGRDTTQSVYVRDSAVAVEKFALAERLERLREWQKSADVYMEILQGYSDRVVPSQVDKDNKIYQYTSVAAAVQERLAKWPEEGMEVYQRRYENEAVAMLDQAGDDLAKLHKIYSTYFVTDAARQAALRLMELYFENADFPAAAWLGDRLLDLHPSLGEQRAGVIYRTAVAYHLAGNAQAAQSKLDELKKDYQGATGTVRGVEVALADSLEHELETSASISRGGSPESWPMPFGSPDRARVPAATGLGGAKLFTIEVKPSTRLMPGSTRRNIEHQNSKDRSDGLMTGILPAIDSGQLFFHDNARIYAVSLESGTPLPGWAETYDGEREGRYAINNAWSTPRAQQSTLCVTENAVYAVMGLPDPIAAQLTNLRAETRLVCLDRRTGKEKWTTSPKLLSDARNFEFIGSPLVIGDAVYLLGRGGKGMQFDDAYVVCLDAGTGKPRWTSYLASASTGMWDFSEANLFGQNVSHLAYSGGRLYALSNLGALAAVDAYDGTIVWLNIYPRDVAEPRIMGGIRPPRTMTTAAKPWTFNPTIVTGGKVFVLPADGRFAHIYDAASGIEEKRIPLRMFDNADTMLGVLDDKLILASQKSIFCVNWAAFDEEKEQKGNIFWLTKFLKSGFPEDSIRGRGFVTTDSVYVPTAWGVHRIAVRSGRVSETYPAGGNWAEDEGPGNILVSGDRLIIAGSQRVNVYTDLKLAMEKLDAAVAAAPDQAEPRLRYAEIMSAAGKWDVALSKLDEAIKVLGGAGAMPAGASRDRVFADALSFAQRTAKENVEATASLTDALFDRAAQSAGSAAQQVNYRLTRARYVRTRANPEAELRLHQEILSDAAMREVLVSAGETGGTRPAAAVAEAAIDDLLRRAGRTLYEPLERAAAEKLQTARDKNQPALFLAVAREFPNSKSAPTALLASADAYEAASDPRSAAQVIREILFKYPQNQDRARLIESLARNYLAMPNRVDVAIARLAQGAKLPGDPQLSRPLKLPDGTVLEKMTFARAVDALREYTRRSAARSLPDICLPPLDQVRKGANRASFAPPTPESIISGVASLPAPLPDFARLDRIVVYSADNRVTVYAAGSNQPIFSSDALVAAPRGMAWVGTNILAWSGDEIALLDGEAGRPLWKWAVRSLPAAEIIEAPDSSGGTEDSDEDAAEASGLRLEGNVENQLAIARAQMRRARRPQVAAIQLAQPPQPPVNAPPAAEQIIHVRPLSDRIIFGTTSGRTVALDLSDGKILWQARLGDRGASHLLASDDFVVLRQEEGPRVQLVVLDALSGQSIRRWVFHNENGANQVPINLALAPDGTLVYIMPDRIRGKDLFEPTDRLTFEVLNRRNEPAPVFMGATAAEHLQISDGRIIVLSDNGAFVRIHSLETGKLLRYKDADAILQTGAKNWQTLLRVVGSRLYILGSRDVLSYELDHPELAWRSRFHMQTVMAPRDALITERHVVALLEPVGAGGGRRLPNSGTPSLSLQAFSRAPIGGGRESAVLEHDPVISDPAGILAWQAVDGGLYYLAGDQKLHFLAGAAKK